MKKVFISMLAVVSALSCNNVDRDNEPLMNKQLSTTDKHVLSEVSKLIGEVLKDKETRKIILNEVNNIDENGNSVSIAYLLGDEEHYSLHEKRQANSITGKKDRTAQKLFKETLLKVYENERENFSKITEAIQEVNAFAKGNNYSITDYIANKDLEVYFPYEENFDWENIDEYSITYEDGNDLAIHDGYLVTHSENITISGIDENYLYENPTMAIIPVDNDYLGDKIAYGYGGVEMIKDPIIPNPYAGTVPPPPANNKIRLTYNVNPFGLADKHLLTTYIPKIRIYDGRRWKRTLSKALRMKIAKAGSEVAVNPAGGLTATPSTFYFRFDVSARDLRRNNWKDVGILWESDWHKAKSEQQMIVWSLRGDARESTVSVDTKLNIDAQGNYTPNTSINVKHNVSSEEKAIHRGNKELSRNFVLSTIVGGAEYDASTYNYNGINYSLRRVSKLEFFFVHDYTSY